MVALLHPQIESPAAGSGRLQLVVDNQPSARSGASASRDQQLPRQRLDSRLDSRPNSLRTVQRSDAVGTLDVQMIVGLVVAAVVVFGGLLFVRVSQGSPGADSWDGVVNLSTAGTSAVGAQVGPVVGSDAHIVVAKPGDTMWSLAQEFAPESDPRPVVAALIEANGGDSLQIGQQIVIPGQLLD